MGVLKLVPPAFTRCPGSAFGCIPPLYWTVGVGTIWQCDHCGRIWERVSRPNVAWADATDREDGSERFRCEHCGDALPSLKSRAAGLPTPDQIRRGFHPDKIVCPECVAANGCPSCETSRMTERENGSEG